MIKAIFWDNDGVLVGTEHLYFQATRDVLGRFGISLTERQFGEISLQAGNSLFTLAEGRLTQQEMEAARNNRNARYAQLLQREQTVLPGVESTLASLHGSVRMAIVTSSRREHFDLIHRDSGLLKYFEFVLTREDYRLSKPHPEPYLAALKRSGLRPEECLVVEDSERGVRAATSAGLRCLAIPGEMNRSGDFSSASRILNDINQVVGAVRQMSGPFPEHSPPKQKKP